MLCCFVQKLQETIRCWHNFQEIEKVITDWLQTAEKLISEKHVDSKQTIENHQVSDQNHQDGMS